MCALTYSSDAVNALSFATSGGGMLLILLNDCPFRKLEVTEVMGVAPLSQDIHAARA